MSKAARKQARKARKASTASRVQGLQGLEVLAALGDDEAGGSAEGEEEAGGEGLAGSGDLDDSDEVQVGVQGALADFMSQPAVTQVG
jgi:hypothetical protein